MAAQRDIKTKLQFEGEKEYNQACKDINSSLRVLSSEMNLLTAEYGSNDKSVEGLTKKQDVLKRQYDEQTKKIAENEKALAQLKAEGTAGADVINRFEVALNKSKTELTKTEKELEKTGEELKKTGKSAEDSKEKFSKLADVIGNVAKGVASGVGIISTAAGALAVKIGKEVVDAFGELEQNLGGSEAVFGEYAQSIQKSGEEAYKNLGVSQSNYLATANKMGALFQGSGVEQQKSLELTEKAMQRAADMASVMGIDMQVALDSVTGAAKGNYAMMDNIGVAMNDTTLKAYALAKGLDVTWEKATQAEKAEIAMQMFFENTEQYAGNFARESTETISGSIGLLQASLQSFVAGLGNSSADITNLTGNVVDAFSAVVNNVVPIIENIANALPDVVTTALAAVDDFAPKLLDTAVNLFSKILGVISEALPVVVEMGVQTLQSLIQGIVDNLPLLVTAALEIIMALSNGIIDMLPMLVDGAAQIVLQLGIGIAQALPELIPKVVEMVVLITETLINSVPLLIDCALQLIEGLAEGILAAIPVLINAIPAIITGILTVLTEGLPKILESGKTILDSLISGIVDTVPLLVDTIVTLIPEIVSTIVSMLPDIIESGVEIITSLVFGIVDAIPQIVAAVPQIINALVDTIIEALPLVVQTGIDLFIALIQALPEIITAITAVIPQIVSSIADALIGNIDKIILAGFQLLISLYERLPEIYIEAGKAVVQIVGSILKAFIDLQWQIKDIGFDLLNSIWEGIKSASKWFTDNINNFFNGIISGVKRALGIQGESGTSKIFEDSVGKNIALSTASGIDKNAASAVKAAEQMSKNTSVAAKKWIADYQKEMDFLAVEEASLQKTVVQQHTAVAEQKIAADKKTTTAKGQSLKQKESAEKSYYENAKLMIADYQNSVEYSIEGEIELLQELGKNYDELSKEKIEIDKNIAKLQEKILKDKAAADKEFYENAKLMIADYQNSVEYSIEGEIELLQELGKNYDALSKEKIEIDKMVIKLQEKDRQEKEKAEKDSFDRSKNWIAEKKKFNLLSMQEEIEAWERVQARYAEGTELRKEADLQVFEARKRLADEQEKILNKVATAEENYEKSVTSRSQAIFNSFGLFNELKEKENKAETALQKAQEQYDKTKESLDKLNQQRKESGNTVEKIAEIEKAYVETQKELSKSTEELQKAQEQASKSQGQILAENLQAQVDEMRDWSKNLEDLAKKGIDEGLLEELRAMGPSANAEIAALSDMSKTELSKYSDLWKEKHEIARKMATKELEKLRDDTNVIIQGLNDDLANLTISDSTNISEVLVTSIAEDISQNIENAHIADIIDHEIASGMKNGMPEMLAETSSIVTEIIQHFNNSRPEFIQQGISFDTYVATGMLEGIEHITNQIPKIVQVIVNKFQSFTTRYHDIGKNIMRGIGEGITSMSSWLNDLIGRYIDRMVRSVEDRLQIHSPSKVFAGIGKFSAEGYGVGFVKQMKQSEKDIANAIPTSFNTTVDSSVTRNSGSIARGENTTEKPQIVVNQFINGNERDYRREKRETAKQFQLIAREVNV